MNNFKPINSSNLEAASYDVVTQQMIVRFKNGTQYRYFDISPELYKAFEETFSGERGLSAGKFFNAHIRHQTSEKIEE
jgi:hypothetical protein